MNIGRLTSEEDFTFRLLLNLEKSNAICANRFLHAPTKSVLKPAQLVMKDIFVTSTYNILLTTMKSTGDIKRVYIRDGLRLGSF